MSATRDFAQMRRIELLAWIGERSQHEDLTASEIADVSGIYSGHGRADRCFDDLKALGRAGLVERYTGRPARWCLTATGYASISDRRAA